MAENNKKISDLTALTTPAVGDLIPIVDVSDTTDASSGTTKKITHANLHKTDTISELTADAGVTIDGVKLKDGGALVITGGSNTFNLTNGTSSFDVAAGKALDINDNLTVTAGQSVTLAAEDAAGTITLDNTTLEVENTNATQRAVKIVVGTDAAATLTVEGTSGIVNQDVTSDGSPTFNALTITSMGGNWTNAGRTVTDAGILSTVDINGGSIDGTTIGGTTAGTIRALFDEDTLITTGNLSANQVSGGVINNYGQSDDCAMTWPTIVEGQSCVFRCATTVAKYWRVVAPASMYIWLDGVKGSAAGYVGIVSATEGACFQITSCKNTGGTYDLMATTISGSIVAG